MKCPQHKVEYTECGYLVHKIKTMFYLQAWLWLGDQWRLKRWIRSKY